MSRSTRLWLLVAPAALVVGVAASALTLASDHQHLPRLGSQSGTVAANPDGTTDLYFGPTAPDGKEANWLQTVPGKGWWTILRLYNPERAFFDKTWRPGEIEPI